MKKATKKLRKESVQSKSDILHTNSSMYYFLELNLSFLVSQEAQIILQQATKKAHPRKNLPMYLKQLYNICTKILKFHYFVNVDCL